MRRHLPNPIPEIWDSLVYWRDYPFWGRQRMKYARDYLKWSWESRFETVDFARGSERLTVILLSWKRIHNIAPMVDSVLSLPFVERVVISNNNPEYRIRDWVRSDDGRIRLIDQPEPTCAGVRYDLMLDEPGEFFFAIDDDVFLAAVTDRVAVRRNPAGAAHPARYSWGIFFDDVERDRASGRIPERLWKRGVLATDDYLNAGLVSAGVRPGSEPKAQHGSLSGLKSADTPVDVLNVCYMLTRAHALEYRRLVRALGLDTRRLYNDDLPVGFCGDERPYCHDVGPFLECLSSARKGVATWRRDGLVKERFDLFRRLRALKPLA